MIGRNSMLLQSHLLASRLLAPAPLPSTLCRTDWRRQLTFQQQCTVPSLAHGHAACQLLQPPGQPSTAAVSSSLATHELLPATAIKLQPHEKQPKPLTSNLANTPLVGLNSEAAVPLLRGCQPPVITMASKQASVGEKRAAHRTSVQGPACKGAVLSIAECVCELCRWLPVKELQQHGKKANDLLQTATVLSCMALLSFLGAALVCVSCESIFSLEWIINLRK